MANLETIAPARTFKDLLNVHDGDNNEGIEAGLKVVQDGEGVASALSLSETEAKVTGDFAITGELSVDSIDVNGVGTTGAGNIATTSLKVDDHLEAGSIETQGDLTVGDNCEIAGELEAQGAYFHGGVETTTFEAENVATLGDGSTLKTDAAPTADAEIANKKYVDDQVGGGSATSLSTGNITATTYGITSDGGVDDVVLAEADTNNSGVLGSAKWDEIVVNTAHSGGDGSDHADVATNTSHSGGDGSDHADVATNTSHSGGDGSDHADVATNTLKATCDTTNVKSALNASLGGAANIGDANDTVTFPGKGDATGNFRVLTASDVYPTSGQGLEVMVNSGTSYILNGTRDGSNISAYHPIRIDGSELGLKISGTEIFSLYSSGLANFKEDLLINGDLEVDGEVDVGDTLSCHGFMDMGREVVSHAGSPTSHQTFSATIPVENTVLVDNSTTRIISFQIDDFHSSNYTYYWALSMVFDGMITAMPKPLGGGATGYNISSQAYRSTSSVVVRMDDWQHDTDASSSEDAEPSEVSTGGGSDIKVFTTATNFRHPNNEWDKVELGLKCNFTGTETGNYEFFANGVVRVFHFCREYDQQQTAYLGGKKLNWSNQFTHSNPVTW
tara:strand:+ start:240 stop:2093 length:1854 start_codon:yes stop_codon:yes gene_type:complete